MNMSEVQFRLHRTRLARLLLFPVLLLAGCPTSPPPPTSGPTSLGQDSSTIIDAGEIRAATNTPTSSASAPGLPDASGPHSSGPLAVVLDVYQLVVPKGAISRNDEFWKRVEEPGTAIDTGIYDLLLKNSVRSGVGDNKDWPFFKDLIDNYHAVVLSGASNPVTEGIISLSMESKIESEDLFWITDRDILYGRTFEHCDNLLKITFSAAPRLVGHCVIHVCPVVRGERRELHYTILNREEPVISEVYPEQLMSLDLEANIPPDHFLIMAPTSDPRPSVLLGSVFFLSNGAAQPMERVLILAPRVVHLTQLR